MESQTLMDIEQILQCHFLNLIKALKPSMIVQKKIYDCIRSYSTLADSVDKRKKGTNALTQMNKPPHINRHRCPALIENWDVGCLKYR